MGSNILGGAMILIGTMSLFALAQFYPGIVLLAPVVSAWYELVHPYLQPLVRVGLAAWTTFSAPKLPKAA
tara:strand:+ start:306 stop:515 length:210 start_codon:yes stop_codon:yes gene_type:complete